MKPWFLRTQDNFLLISEDGVTSVDQPTGSHPCLLSPSLNFRSYLTIPRNTNRNVEALQKDLFDKNLPQPIEDLKCQFVPLGYNEEGHQQILAMAVKTDIYRELNQEYSFSEIYFFESQLTKSNPDIVTLTRIYFPDGLFYVVRDDRMIWSQMIQNSGGKQQELTEEYVRDEFDFSPVERAIDPLDSPEQSGSQWAQNVNELLPDSLDRGLDLRNGAGADFFRPIRQALTMALILVLLSSGLWIWYENRLQSQLKNWMSEEYVKVVGESSSAPRESLNDRLARLSGGEQSPSQPLYPRLVLIDESLTDRSLKVLRFGTSSERTRMVVLSPDLETVESFRDSLTNNSDVESVQIDSSDSRSYGDYNYEVQLTVQWGMTG